MSTKKLINDDLAVTHFELPDGEVESLQLPNKLIGVSIRQERTPFQKEIRKARDSLAYWWYRSLQLHKGYLDCCENEGAGPYAEIYADFGNVRLGFQPWWQLYGRKATSEQEPIKAVEKLSDSRVARLHIDHPDRVVLSVPLTMRRATAMRKIRALLEEEYAQRDPVNIWKASTAKRMVIKSKVRKATIAHLLRLFELRQEYPDDSLVELGRRAGIEIDFNARSTHGVILRVDEEHRRMQIAVSRQLLQAKNLIENAARGDFPSLKKPA